MPEGLEPVLLTHFAPDEPARPTETVPAAPGPRTGRGRHRKPRLPAPPAKRLAMVAVVTFVVAGGTGVLIAVQMLPSPTAIPATGVPGEHRAAVDGPGRAPLAVVAAPTTSTAGTASAPKAAAPVVPRATARPAPPAPPVTTTRLPFQPGPVPAAGQPCATPGSWTVNTRYQPMQCLPGAGGYTWQVRWP